MKLFKEMDIRGSWLPHRSSSMIRRFCLFAYLGIALVGSSIVAAQNSDHTASPALIQAVDAAFPDSLRFVPAPPDGEGTPVQPYHSCASVFSQNADGSPNLVIAGFSGSGSEVAMLGYQQGKVHIVDTTSVLEKALMAEGCESDIVNLADPTEPMSPLAKAISVSFSDGPLWFFIWDGSRLRNITALEPGSAMPQFNIPPGSAMYGGEIVDIDRTGPMQIIGPKGNNDKEPQEDGISATGTLVLFRFNGTTYEPTKTLLECDEYEPNLPKTHDDKAFYKGDIGPWMSHIAMHESPAPSYQLKIVNGDRDGSKRVSSAQIEVNGALVVEPNEINQGMEILTRSIQLQKANKIKVTVDGTPGSHVYVIVE
jgi:hypothetical protein